MAEVEGVSSEEAGSQAYQNEHMGMIFEEGFSFSGFERDKLFIGDGTARFTDLSSISGVDDPNDGRASVVADFDDDGDVDLFVHNIARARHRLYRNDCVDLSGDDLRFVKLRLRGTRGAPDAVGAVVQLTHANGGSHPGRIEAQVLAFGSGFVSQSAPELVFGLGDAPGGNVDVIWPGGVRESFGAVEPGARLMLVEGSGQGEPFPRRPSPFKDPAPPGLRVDLGADLAAMTVLDDQGDELRLDLTSGGGETWLNFWASWCAGCRQELPALAELAHEPGKRLVMVSVDAPEDWTKAATALQQKNVDTEPLFASRQVVEDVIDVDRLSLPMTLVIDSQGKLVRIINGRIDD